MSFHGRFFSLVFFAFWTLPRQDRFPSAPFGSLGLHHWLAGCAAENLPQAALVAEALPTNAAGRAGSFAAPRLIRGVCPRPQGWRPGLHSQRRSAAPGTPKAFASPSSDPK